MLRVLAVDGEISTYSLREKYQELYNKSQLVKKAEEENISMYKKLQMVFWISVNCTICQQGQ